MFGSRRRKRKKEGGAVGDVASGAGNIGDVGDLADGCGCDLPLIALTIMAGASLLYLVR